MRIGARKVPIVGVAANDPLLIPDETEPLEDVQEQLEAVVAQLAAAEASVRSQKAALAHVADGVVLLDRRGRIGYANPIARWLLQNRDLDAFGRLSNPTLEALVDEAVETRRPITREITLATPEPRCVAARAMALMDGCVLLLHDRTEADRVDRLRRDFVDNVSHELKTPVAAVRALADVASQALGQSDVPTAQGFMHRLQLECERLSRLVIDLLDLSRVESGEALNREVVDVRGVLGAARERSAPIAEAKGVTITVAPDGVTVDADPGQLAMAVHNLVENAVRYSDSGTVSLSATATPEGAEVAVSDEGIGIPAAELPRIFERFYRVDKARSRATGGTGLGLAIVKHVVENHGGRIEVVSEPGRGSTFTILLPHTPAAG